MWRRALPAVSIAKGRRLERHLATLLPREVQPSRPLFALSETPALWGAPSPSDASRVAGGVAGPAPGDLVVHEETASVVLARPLLDVDPDGQAAQSLIQVRAGSLATVRIYQREAHWRLLWLQYERGGATLAQMGTPDCGALMAILQNIPPRWISRVRSAPGTPGWAPFRGLLSHQSCRQSIAIVASLFAWLQSAQYLAANPWVLVNRLTGDDPGKKMLDTKALSEAAMLEVLRFVDAQTPFPSRARIQFTLLFVEAVGLRSAELLLARLGDLRMESEDWVMQVRARARITGLRPCPGRRFMRCRST